MPNTHLKIGGSFKPADNISVKVSNAWKQVASAYIKVGGAWKKVWPANIITLSGTAGTPNTNTVGSVTPRDLGWSFNSDGTVDKLDSVAGDSIFQSGTEWSDSTPSVTYYIRFTEEVALSGDGDYTGASSTLNVWLALTSNRPFEIDDPAGTGSTSVTMKVEIATDSGGSDIVATGYYSLDNETEV